ncbi:MAG: RDD family protein [Clostridia bacterium]|mgnify:CR=1 FL=1|nr:RDD family protein [Clostridia bacterium]
MNNNVRIRRILAWIIDWNLSGLPCMLYTTIFMDVFKRPSIQNLGYILIMMLLVFLYPVIFVFRDLIFRGRSVGKRLFKLHILDKNTNEIASKKQKIIRNLFFFLYFVDGIVLISTKESIGDRIANTIVVKNSQKGEMLYDQPNSKTV